MYVKIDKPCEIARVESHYMHFSGNISRRWLSLKFLNHQGHQIVGFESDPYESVVVQDWIQEKGYVLEKEI